MTLRSWLYAAARLLGDLQALAGGPVSFVRRPLRKAALRNASKPWNRL